MATIKLGEPFGLDNAALAKVNWSLAIKRVIHDLKSDFIYAPHLSFIYNKAGEEVIDTLKHQLKSGTFNPGVPLTIEVPKSFRIRVAVQSKRLGPSFSRPGSILPPLDRLFYQALADEAAPIIDEKLDDTRSFSHQLMPFESPNMFLPTRTCWRDLQQALTNHAKSSSVQYIVKIDIANFFGSLNQHTLINVLNDAGYPPSLSSRLEAMLTRYTGERSSRGILQGMYPSDLFGNYYLAPIDRFLKDASVLSARYVDDIYMFVQGVEAGDFLLRTLIPELRTYDLVINEAKSVIMPKSALITEEPDLEALFAAAFDEIAAQVADEDFHADYGFQSEWDDEAETDDADDKPSQPDEDELELEATTVLFDSISEFPGYEESIERFCLPIFTRADSDHAVSHVCDAFRKRPAMSQIYASYLAQFLADADVVDFLRGLLTDTTLMDWQKMWILAALSQAETASDESVKVALDLLKDANRHDALRAVAAVYVGRFGDHGRRKALIAIYGSVSNYIQAAIYYSSSFWPGVERSNAKASWSGHGLLHAFLTSGFAKK